MATKKNYSVSVDFIMSRTIEVEAESEEQAKSYLSSEIQKNPYNFAHSFSHFVGHKIIDVNEEI